MVMFYEGSLSPRYRVLIVDDEPDIRDVISEVLTSKGHICDQASNGIEALNAFQKKYFDAVITDIMMPEMDGISLAQQLTKEHPGLPIMIMTALPEESKRRIDEVTLNITSFISKPFSLTEFWNRFQKMMLSYETSRKQRK